MPRFDDLKIFAVSEVEPGSLGLATGREGINGWFPKPFEPAALLAAIQDALAAERR